MGKALYRKHRSTTFDQIIGQGHITDTLKRAVDKGAVSHAYLFSGPRGTGKTSTARVLAHVINDIEYESENSHIDIIEIDAASNRRIDEMRSLRETVAITPTSAKYKVYIIDEAHMLTREAANALLKTLEEPPEHVVFMLATTEPHKLPDTILSRTQHFRFCPIETDSLAKHLTHVAKAEGITLKKDAAELIATRAQGGARDSLSLLDQLISRIDGKTIDQQHVTTVLGLASDELIVKITDALATNDAKDVLDALTALSESGAQAEQIAEQLIDHLHESDPAGSIALCRDLLAVRTSSRPGIALRLSLLASMSLEPAVASKPEPVVTPAPTPPEPITEVKPALEAKAVSPPAPKPKAKVKEPAPEIKTKKPAPKLPQATATSETVAQIPEQWTEILEAGRDTLQPAVYGVLRMCKPEVRDNRLYLVFRFPFHQKKAEDHRFASPIRDLITEQLQADVEIKMTNKNAWADLDATGAVEPAAGNVDSIIDIMGGGEEVQV